VPSTKGKSSNPVFVVGVFRSGTSLLYSLLNQHPQVALMYECDVWDFPRAFSGSRFRGEWLQRQEFYNQALSRHRLTFGENLRGLENVRTPEDLYRCYGETKDAKLWGEKSPLYSARLGQLARQYPDAAFIIIWRDPVEIYRSVLVAGKKAPFFRRPGMLHRLIHHKEKMIHEIARLRRAGVRIHDINYDDLVDQTETACRNVCEFLKIEFDPGMVGLERADFSAVYRAPQHEFLRRGVVERQKISGQVVETNVAQKLLRFRKRWERLTARQLALNDSVLKATEPSPSELMFHKTIGALLHIGENIKRLHLNFFRWPGCGRIGCSRHGCGRTKHPVGAFPSANKPASTGSRFFVAFSFWRRPC